MASNTDQTTSITLNFLAARRKQLSQLQNNDKKYAKWMAFVFGGVLVITVVAFFIDLFLTRTIQQIQREQKETERSISSLASVEVEYLTLIEKLSSIRSLIGSQAEKQAALEYFTTLFAAQEATISEVNFAADNQLQFLLGATNVFTLRQMITSLQAESVRAVYPNIQVSNITREKEGDYTSLVIIQLSQDTL